MKSISIILLLSAMVVAGSSMAGAGNIKLSRQISTNELSAPPVQISIHLYELQQGGNPVFVQEFYAGEWTTDIDLSQGLPSTAQKVAFELEIATSELIHPEKTLWVEMEVDGVLTGERSQLRAVGTGGVSIDGLIESRSTSTGGFKFPDGSIQTTAADDGTVTSIIAGSGLSGGTITSAGTISVDSSQTQSRVGGSCSTGSSIRAINASGAVTCETDNLGATTSDLTTHTNLSSAHHSKYSDAEAVSAIKAADGTGSNLDADLLDGMHASEVIAAAQILTPIDSLPYTISSSGSYYVTENLDGSGGGIDINVDNVTLDLMGFTLNGSSFDDYGIHIQSKSNVTIKNGTIRGFGKAGIFQSYSFASFNKVLNVQALGNGTLGSAATYSGIHLAGKNSRIIQCTAGDNGGYGISGSSAAIIDQNTVYNNGGIYGISGGRSSTLTRNVSYNHQGAQALQATNSIIANNTVYNSQEWGIYANSGSLVKDNLIYLNNLSANTLYGGLLVNNDSRVVGNTLRNNKQRGIRVNGSGNILRENHITDTSPGYGILFTISGNYYQENTASGNGTAFSLGITTQTDGGGNVSF